MDLYILTSLIFFTSVDQNYHTCISLPNGHGHYTKGRKGASTTNNAMGNTNPFYQPIDLIYNTTNIGTHKEDEFGVACCSRPD
jgi:hypothetical protein